MPTATPTDTERAALKRIASLRTGLVVPVFVCFLGLLISTQASSDLPALILAGASVLLLVGLVVYASFCLRCPRCSSWIPVPSNRSRCTECGIALEISDDKRHGPRPHA